MENHLYTMNHLIKSLTRLVLNQECFSCFYGNESKTLKKTCNSLNVFLTTVLP